MKYLFPKGDNNPSKRPEIRNKISNTLMGHKHSVNLITLCHSCHMKTNSNREYWLKYFYEKRM